MQKQAQKVFPNSGQVLAANYLATDVASRKKRRLFSALEQSMQRFMEDIDMQPAKKIACTNEARFIITTIFDILAVCQKDSAFEKSLDKLEHQVTKLHDSDGLRNILDYWFRQVIRCICIDSADLTKMSPQLKIWINHIVTAMIEAYPDLQYRLVATASMKEYRHNCDAIAEYFHERPHAEPVMCSEMER